jgi:hypothetical protein
MSVPLDGDSPYQVTLRDVAGRLRTRDEAEVRRALCLGEVELDALLKGRAPFNSGQILIAALLSGFRACELVELGFHGGEEVT